MKNGGNEATVAPSFSDSLHHPFLLAERTSVVLLHPQTHAAVVEGVVAVAPNDHAVVMLKETGNRENVKGETIKGQYAHLPLPNYTKT